MKTTISKLDWTTLENAPKDYVSHSVLPDEIHVTGDQGETSIYIRKPRPGSLREALVTPATIADVYRFAFFLVGGMLASVVLNLIFL